MQYSNLLLGFLDFCLTSVWQRKVSVRQYGITNRAIEKTIFGWLVRITSFESNFSTLRVPCFINNKVTLGIANFGNVVIEAFKEGTHTKKSIIISPTFRSGALFVKGYESQYEYEVVQWHGRFKKIFCCFMMPYCFTIKKIQL